MESVFNRFSTLIKGINNPYDMWISTKLDQTSYIDQCFNELITECRLSAPGARLSYSIRNKLERLSKEERKVIVSR
ncbi:unnamed protein product, partial [Oppiella nova]